MHYCIYLRVPDYYLYMHTCLGHHRLAQQPGMGTPCIVYLSSGCDGLLLWGTSLQLGEANKMQVTPPPSLPFGLSCQFVFDCALPMHCCIYLRVPDYYLYMHTCLGHHRLAQPAMGMTCIGYASP